MIPISQYLEKKIFFGKNGLNETNEDTPDKSSLKCLIALTSLRLLLNSLYDILFLHSAVDCSPRVKEVVLSLEVKVTAATVGSNPSQSSLVPSLRFPKGAGEDI